MWNAYILKGRTEMRKKIFLLIAGLLVSQLLLAEPYEVIFDYALKDRHIQLLGIPDGKKYLDDKVLVLLDSSNNKLDEVDVLLGDGENKDACVFTGDAAAIKVRIRNPYQNCFVYATSSSDKFARYDCERWVADAIVTGNYIIYSTEMVSNTVRRVSLADNTMFEYKGYYPNVDLFVDETEEGMLGIFKDEGFWYELYEDGSLVKSDRQYAPEKKRHIYDYWGKS